MTLCNAFFNVSHQHVALRDDILKDTGPAMCYLSSVLRETESHVIKEVGSLIATPDYHYRVIIESMDEVEVIEFVSARTKEAIEDTRRTRIKVELALGELQTSC